MLLAVFLDSTATRMPLEVFERTIRLSIFCNEGSNVSPRATTTGLL